MSVCLIICLSVSSQSLSTSVSFCLSISASLSLFHTLTFCVKIAIFNWKTFEELIKFQRFDQNAFLYHFQRHTRQDLFSDDRLSSHFVSNTKPQAEHGQNVLGFPSSQGQMSTNFPCEICAAGCLISLGLDALDLNPLEEFSVSMSQENLHQVTVDCAWKQQHNTRLLQQVLFTVWVLGFVRCKINFLWCDGRSDSVVWPCKRRSMSNACDPICE